MIRAAIDIGSNSLLLCIAEVKAGKIEKILYEEQAMAGLGSTIKSQKNFSPQSMFRAREILHKYHRILSQYPTKKIFCGATEASRQAQNAPEFFQEITKELGFKIEVITPQEEAYFATQGVLCDPLFPKIPMTLLDMGGASTEVISPAEKFSFISLPLGVLSYQEMSVSAKEELFYHYQNEAQAFSQKSLLGIAGSMTAIYLMLKKVSDFSYEHFDYTWYTVGEIQSLEEKVKRQDVSSLLAEYPFLASRTHVIREGLELLLDFCKYLKVEKFSASPYGLRHGLLLK